MPANIKPEQVQQIIELRAAGHSINQVAAIVGVTRGTVIARTRAPGGKKRSTHAPQHQELIEVEVDEYADVQPMWPYPDDLPDLALDPMNWTPEELALMGEWSREILFFDPIL